MIVDGMAVVKEACGAIPPETFAFVLMLIGSDAGADVALIDGDVDGFEENTMDGEFEADFEGTRDGLLVVASTDDNEDVGASVGEGRGACTFVLTFRFTVADAGAGVSLLSGTLILIEMGVDTGGGEYITLPEGGADDCRDG